jgi:hypothetical protein
LVTNQDEHLHSADLAAITSGASFVPEHVAEVERSNECPTNESVKVTHPPRIALDGLQVEESDLSLPAVNVSNLEELEQTSNEIQSEDQSAAIHPGYTLSPELPEVNAVTTKESSSPGSTIISVEDTPAQGISLVPRFSLLCSSRICVDMWRGSQPLTGKTGRARFP